VPGFPAHPHRGFETVTIVRRGLIDHSDSLGATARYGVGDVQWLTAGGGVVHAEMFPLVDDKGPNPLELFQIWLNLPRARKMVKAAFTMFWSHTIPTVSDGGAHVKLIAGSLGGQAAPAPPKDSWAAHPDSDVAIWTIRLEPGARFTLPPTSSNRVLFYFRGGGLKADGNYVAVQHSITGASALENGAEESELLLLQGRPIGEPVVQYGPFVMTTPEEIQQAFVDYRRTRFGEWRFGSDDPVHARDEGRFARHADGRVERP
jgi:quercetin 2,3-dioxygenase